MRRTVRGLACLALLVGAFGAGLPASVMAADAALNQQLLSAARSGDEAGVQAALDAGAVVDSRNRIGDTALITACKNGAAGIARTVIEHGANVRQADASGVTPLMGAAYGGYDELVALLLAHGADPASTDQVGKTAMEYAAGQGHTAVVQRLLDAGVDVNRVYKNDLTALMWAAGYDHPDTIKLLLARGADPALRDNRGMTAGDIAAQTGSSHAAVLLSAHERTVSASSARTRSLVAAASGRAKGGLIRCACPDVNNLLH